ncbi:MAG: NADPH-dependent FMN reductase [Flavobacteriales bacterium]
MKKILAFAGSNSKNSINKQLVTYVAQQTKKYQVNILDLNDFELPLYGIDYETENRIPEKAQLFLNLIQSCDGIILSLAEHNGSYTVAFKNLLDWMSRIDGKLWSNKPMFLLATSPGVRGGASVLEIAKARFPYMGGNIISNFSLPSFKQNFSENGLTNKALKLKLQNELTIFENAL